jgi:hypothetical protein
MAANRGVERPDGLGAKQSYSIHMSSSAVSARVQERLAEMDIDRDGQLTVGTAHSALRARARLQVTRFACSTNRLEPSAHPSCNPPAHRPTT